MHLIWTVRQWLHSTFYGFSFCSLSISPFFGVGAESQLLWGWEVDTGQSRHVCFPVFMSSLGTLIALKKEQPLLPALSARLPAPGPATGFSLPPLLSRRKWVSAGTNLLPVFLFFPFLSNGNQSERFLRMRGINLSAAIYTVLVTTVSKCSKYVFAALPEVVFKPHGLSRAGVSQTSSGVESQETSKSHSYSCSGCGRLAVGHKAVGCCAVGGW